MPPARRGRANKAKANGDLSLGDLVLAKVKGFPAWPAKVRIPSSNVLLFFFSRISLVPSDSFCVTVLWDFEWICLGLEVNFFLFFLFSC